MEYLSYLCIGVSLLMIISEFFFAHKNTNKPKKWKKGDRYAFLIPARNESLVIEELLQSIMNQTKKIPPQDVYVIVEDKQDPTVEIVRKYKMNICYRSDLSLKRKGYALDDAVKEILQKKKHYDAYFIFDADNVLMPTFVEEIEKSLNQGYEIVLGYRNCKNGNDSVLAASSALTFSMINTLGNERKRRNQENMTISGTGFCIRGDILESWGGYPFHSLTEDYELTLYATICNYTTTYNKKAVFYDEQPTSLSQSVKQRIRWIRGYFDNQKKYRQQLLLRVKKGGKNVSSSYAAFLGVYPFLILIIGIILLFIEGIWSLLKNMWIRDSYLPLLINIGAIVLVVYLALVLITLTMLLKEEKIFNLTRSMKIKALLFNPIFLSTYLWCALRAFSQKEVSWDSIEHKSKLDPKR